MVFTKTTNLESDSEIGASLAARSSIKVIEASADDHCSKGKGPKRKQPWSAPALGN